MSNTVCTIAILCFFSVHPFSTHVNTFSNFAVFVVFGEALLPQGPYRLCDNLRPLVQKLDGWKNYRSSLGFLGFLSF